MKAYSPMAKDGDWKRVALYIENSEKNGEPILIFRNENVLPFSYYYKGPNKVIPLPDNLNFESYDFSSPILKSEQTIFQSLTYVPDKNQRLRIVTHHTTPYLGVDINPAVLEEFIYKYCSVIDRKAFYETEVRYLQFLDTPKQ